MIDSGVAWIVVECAFGDEDFRLPDWMAPIRVRTKSVLWPKERLLNLAIRRLPARCTKVAWLDADVSFENVDWMTETSAVLETCNVVQPFDVAVRLPRGACVDDGTGVRWESFASVMLREPDAIAVGSFGAHGHTGFAWAARRDIVERHGLYDCCVAGRGDHLIAHGLGGDWESACIDRITGGGAEHRAHAVAWCERIYEDVRARIGCVRGTLLHQWHGDVAARRYQDSLSWLGAQSFDPAADLCENDDGVWEWRRDGESRSAWMRDYFRRRDIVLEE